MDEKKIVKEILVVAKEIQVAPQKKKPVNF